MLIGGGGRWGGVLIGGRGGVDSDLGGGGRAGC